MLGSLGFASGLSLPLGIITILINDLHPSTLPWLLKVLSIDLLKVIILFVCQNHLALPRDSISPGYYFYNTISWPYGLNLIEAIRIRELVQLLKYYFCAATATMAATAAPSRRHATSPRRHAAATPPPYTIYISFTTFSPILRVLRKSDSQTWYFQRGDKDIYTVRYISSS